MEIAQAEFNGFPQSQVETAPEPLLKRFLRLSEEKGPLVPQSMIDDILGVSRARACQFLSEGRFQVFDVGNKTFVSLHELAAFKSVERRPGRPWAKK